MNMTRRRLLAGASLAALALRPHASRAVLGKLGAGSVGKLGGSGGGGAAILLSNSFFDRFVASGSTIGTLSVSRGIGSYTFSFTSNPGTLFAISGNNLNTNSASIDTGSYPVGIQADNGAGSVVNATFTLTARSEPIPFVF